MAFICFGDFTDLWYKLRERGMSYAAKKLVSDASARIQSTWEEDDLPGSNWWQVEAVRKRWNRIITGSEGCVYPDYFVQKWMNDKQGLSMLSVGCGTGQREIEFARHSCFSRIDAFDISLKAIADAKKTAQQEGLTTCNFYTGDVYTDEWPAEVYDVVLFHSSLHHFSKITSILQKVRHTLKPGGLIIINEYVGANRFQFNSARKRKVRRIYKEIVPERFKTRRDTMAVKSNVYFPGLLRMIISDPSEAAASQTIMPLMHEYFELLEQKNYGGNLLTFILKDIAHHFNTREAESVLPQLFALEDQMMQDEGSADFVYAVFRKRL